MAWKIVRTLGPGLHSLDVELVTFGQDGVGWTLQETVAAKAAAFPTMFRVEETDAIPVEYVAAHTLTSREPRDTPETIEDESLPLSPNAEAVREVLELTELPPPGEWTQARLEEETVATLREVADVLNLDVPRAALKHELIMALLVAQEDVVLPDDAEE